MAGVSSTTWRCGVMDGNNPRQRSLASSSITSVTGYPSTHVGHLQFDGERPECFGDIEERQRDQRRRGVARRFGGLTAL